MSSLYCIDIGLGASSANTGLPRRQGDEKEGKGKRPMSRTHDGSMGASINEALQYCIDILDSTKFSRA